MKGAITMVDKLMTISRLLMVSSVGLYIGCASSQSQPPSVPEPPKPPSAESAPGPTDIAPPTPQPSLPDLPEAPEPSASSADGENTSSTEQGPPGVGDSEAAEGDSMDRPGAPMTSGAAGGGAETSAERRARLEGELDASLREFDGLILREQTVLDQNREDPGGGGAGGIAGGSGASGGTGAEGGDYRDDDSSEGSDSETQMAGGTGGSPDRPEGGPPVGPEGSASDTTGTESGRSRVPSDVGDGADDDIVARQLREAAMAEEDPALQERLWDEYRAYKNSTKR